VRTFGIQKTLPLVVIAMVVLALALPPAAWPQGCSLCYTQAANSGSRLIRALRNGIVILIIPPLSMCIAAMVFTYRKRNQFHQSNGMETGSDW
jgi:hypothetical protein